MLLYHGSYSEIKTPDLNYGRYNLDFGKGFYVTGHKEQAEKWALRRAMAARHIRGFAQAGFVTVYESDLDSAGLNILSFDGYSESWLDFVVANRGNLEAVYNSKYDVIYGNVADDDVAQAVDAYMELLRKNRVNKTVKDALLYQLTFSHPNDQYCFVTNKSLALLKFLHSYEVEDANK
ncbi:MAG: DUF3990 domain-containing protein [Spirochaetes bacterium]|nr:DUF3990 domain-containing protein [Spirochaetota bacterium]